MEEIKLKWNAKDQSKGKKIKLSTRKGNKITLLKVVCKVALLLGKDVGDDCKGLKVILLSGMQKSMTGQRRKQPCDSSQNWY